LGARAEARDRCPLTKFERAIIQERVRAGLRRARETGTKSGRAIGRPTIGMTSGRYDPELEGRIKDRLARGVSYRVTARECGVALGTVQRIAATLRPFGGDGEPAAA
jgi:DNA invertase Pin-like site-specific DNA recombinase